MIIESRKPKIPRKPPTLEVTKRHALRITPGKAVRAQSPVRNCWRSYCVSATGSAVGGLVAGSPVVGGALPLVALIAGVAPGAGGVDRGAGVVGAGGP